MKESFKDYAKTGFKLIVLNIITAILAWIIAAILGVTFLAIFNGTAGTLLTIIFLIFVIAIILFVNGWLARKIWGWK